jgi:hypothetical protein
VIGGVVGGLVGSEVAEDINPTAEEAYWKENYRNRPYVSKDSSFETYQPAYRSGIDAYSQNRDKRFADIEPQLSQDWEKRNSSLSWEEAKPASQDAFDRLANSRKTQA